MTGLLPGLHPIPSRLDEFDDGQEGTPAICASRGTNHRTSLPPVERRRTSIGTQQTASRRHCDRPVARATALPSDAAKRTNRNAEADAKADDG